MQRARKTDAHGGKHGTSITTHPATISSQEFPERSHPLQSHNKHLNTGPRN